MVLAIWLKTTNIKPTPNTHIPDLLAYCDMFVDFIKWLVVHARWFCCIFVLFCLLLQGGDELRQRAVMSFVEFLQKLYDPYSIWERRIQRYAPIAPPVPLILHLYAVYCEIICAAYR